MRLAGLIWNVGGLHLHSNVFQHTLGTKAVSVDCTLITEELLAKGARAIPTSLANFARVG